MSDDDDIEMAPGPFPGQVRNSVIVQLSPYLEEVDTTASTLIARLGDLIAARRTAHGTRLTDWAGPFRDDFEGQFPAGQGELAGLIDEVQALQAAAREAAYADADDREYAAQHGGSVVPGGYV